MDERTASAEGFINQLFLNVWGYKVVAHEESGQARRGLTRVINRTLLSYFVSGQFLLGYHLVSPYIQN
jgi:hypothetical protein